MDFKTELEKRVECANSAIQRYLPANEDHIGMLAEAMRYSIIAGGKRLRPIMMGECYRIFGGKDDDIQPFQAAMEFIHTSSLIHDDLPAIDNSKYRRGKETTHYKFGEPLGILSGDALLNYAYEVLTDGVIAAKNTAGALKAAKIISVKSGYRGMLGGQDVDVETEKKGLSGDKHDILNYIYEKKTAALFEASMMAGASLAGAGDDELLLLEKAGRSMGIAFQIQDDILDVTGTADKLGKPVLSDEANGKDTYVGLFGLDESKKAVQRLTDEAVSMIKGFGENTEFLINLMQYLISREM